MTDPTPPPEQPAEQPSTTEPAAPTQGPYPPPQAPQPPYGWAPTPPPPPRSNTVAWIGVALGGVALLLSLGAIGFAGLAWFAEPGYYDDYGSMEEEWSSDGYVDDEAVYIAVEDSCAELSEVGRGVDVLGSPEDLATRLTEITAAGRTVVTDAEGEESTEEDVQVWIDDLTTVLDAVDEHGAALEAGRTPDFQEPTTEDDESLISRISFMGPYGCELPAVLSVLDPTPPEPYDEGGRYYAG